MKAIRMHSRAHLRRLFNSVHLRSAPLSTGKELFTAPTNERYASVKCTPDNMPRMHQQHQPNNTLTLRAPSACCLELPARNASIRANDVAAYVLIPYKAYTICFV